MFTMHNAQCTMHNGKFSRFFSRLQQLSALFLFALASQNSSALAMREVNNALNSGADCQAGVWSRDIAILKDGDEICVFHAVDSTNGGAAYNNTIITLPTSTTATSYARDTMTANFKLQDVRRRQVQLMITPGFEKIRPHFAMGATLRVNLPIAGTDNGQTVYKLDNEGNLGLKLWLSILAGLPNTVRNNPQFQVNNSFADLSNYKRVLNNDGENSLNINIDSQVVLLKPEALTKGTLRIEHSDIGLLQLQASEASKLRGKIDYNIRLTPANYTFTQRTCSYNGASKLTVEMDKIGLGHFANKNEVYGGTTNIQLTCPAGANLEPYVTFTDNSKLSNETDILTLSSGSTARNVGIRVYLNDNQAIKFGPLVFNAGTEGTSVQAVTKKDYAIKLGNRSQNAQNYNLKLTAKYARTNNKPVQPGKVNGEMMFTFSYY